jgi:exopolyphosphatase/guanosine-5'-triphosphate,3'-diphosphate pyrophosphatase
MREASNGETVVERVRKTAGISIDIIDGSREAEVIYANHVEHRLDPRRNYLYIDVGGGSTEVSLIVRGKMEGTESFAVGRRARAAGQGRSEGHRAASPVGGSAAQGARQHGGDREAAAISIRSTSPRASSRASRSTSSKLRTIRDMLRKYSLEERIVTLNLRPDRADVIVFAADLYLSVMKWGRIRKMVVPEVGLADGIVHLLYSRHRRARARSA